MRQALLRALIGSSICAICAAAAPSTAPADSSHDKATTKTATTRENHNPQENHPAGEGDHLAVTQHQITLNGQTIHYDATAGTMQLKGADGKPTANFFFVAYTKTDAGDASNRPITFIFNGGPGAAAVWLHLGAIGPERVNLNDEGMPGPPPHKLVENPQCWLDLTDLVFIDPVGTGYSRAIPTSDQPKFLGVRADIESVGDFIHLYLSRNNRWGSPKFLAGESYGTTRAAMLSEHLLDRYGIDLNGIVLISTVLNFETILPSSGNDLPYELYLPSYAAIAAYHHKLGDADITKLLPEVEKYALGDYAHALSEGGAITKAEHDDVVQHLVKYTGLPADFIDKVNLRIDPADFRQELLADQRLILGRFDARVTGYNPSPLSGEDYDPSLSRLLPVYSNTFNEYVKDVLKYDSDLTYEVLNPRLGQWSFGESGTGFLNVTGDLRDAMMKNPNLKVLVCSGRQDLATPFLATIYTLAHLDPTGQLQKNITEAFYDSGHMIYHRKSALVKLKKDVTTFYTSATSKPANGEK